MIIYQIVGISYRIKYRWFEGDREPIIDSIYAENVSSCLRAERRESVMFFDFVDSDSSNTAMRDT